jgi:flagellar protein FlaG
MDSVQASTASAAAPMVARAQPAQSAQQAGQPAESSAVQRVVVAAKQVNHQISQTRQSQNHEPAFDAKEMRQRLQEAVDRLNEQMKSTGRDLAFGIDEQIDRSIITVKSSTSGELVRQIPGDDVLRVARSIEELKGVLYDEFF